ncbi:MAG: pyruvate kinase, partial [Clostridia bacterium]|nr:pyruvate kinase [Clostridia bacterium]
MKKTKIICTIGPASSDKKTIAAMTEVGCDVVRLNFSHGTHADYAEKIKMIKEVREEKRIP